MPEMPNPTRIFLLRHGAVVPEARDHFNGVTDVDLDPIIGPTQIGRVADYLAEVKLEALYSSPLKRCRATAAVLAEKFGLTNTVVQNLHEMNFGLLEGLGFSQVREQHPEQMAGWFRDLANYRMEGGESMSQVQDRAWEALNGLVEAHPEQHIAVAAHGAVNRLVLARALKMDIQNVLKIAQDYGCLNILDFFPDGEVVIKGVNIQPGQDWPGNGLDHTS